MAPVPRPDDGRPADSGDRKGAPDQSGPVRAPLPPPSQDPEAQLEQALIDEFLRLRGHDATSVERLPADERLRLLQGASAYAAGKLAEIEARARYVHELHGSDQRS